LPAPAASPAALCPNRISAWGGAPATRRVLDGKAPGDAFPSPELAGASAADHASPGRCASAPLEGCGARAVDHAAPACRDSSGIPLGRPSTAGSVSRETGVARPNAGEAPGPVAAGGSPEQDAGREPPSSAVQELSPPSRVPSEGKASAFAIGGATGAGPVAPHEARAAPPEASDGPPVGPRDGLASARSARRTTAPVPRPASSRSSATTAAPAADAACDRAAAPCSAGGSIPTPPGSSVPDDARPSEPRATSPAPRELPLVIGAETPLEDVASLAESPLPTCSPRARGEPLSPEAPEGRPCAWFVSAVTPTMNREPASIAGPGSRVPLPIAGARVSRETTPRGTSHRPSWPATLPVPGPVAATTSASPVTDPATVWSARGPWPSKAGSPSWAPNPWRTPAPPPEGPAPPADTGPLDRSREPGPLASSATPAGVTSPRPSRAPPAALAPASATPPALPATPSSEHPAAWPPSVREGPSSTSASVRCTSPSSAASGRASRGRWPASPR
jgi:hypothetical protein